MNETLHIADLVFEVRRGPRRKTLGLTVDRAGELVVHTPQSASEEELRKWVNRKLLWVHRKLAQKQEMNFAVRTPEFVSGESFYYLGKNYRLRVVEQSEAALTFDGERFLLRQVDFGDAVQHFRKWYLKSGTPWLTQRVATWESRVNVTPSRVKVSDLGFRWGSCGKNNVVQFNWRVSGLPYLDVAGTVRDVVLAISPELGDIESDQATFLAIRSDPASRSQAVSWPKVIAVALWRMRRHSDRN